MKKKNSLVGLWIGSFVCVLALGSYALACDGYGTIEKRNKRYEHLDLTVKQKTEIQKIKDKVVASFRAEHRSKGCDHYHNKHGDKFVAEADNVLTNVQRMELRTGEKISSLQKELKDLKQEIRELKQMVRTLMNRR